MYSTEVISFSPPRATYGQELPHAFRGHCTVYVNGYIIITGGLASRQTVLSIKADTGDMSYMSDMIAGHANHGCASFTSGNKSFVVVAGFEKTTEILDVAGNVWNLGKKQASKVDHMIIIKSYLGPDLPTTCTHGKMVSSPEKNGVILLGTNCQDQYNFNQLFHMKVQPDGTFKWIALNRSLKYRRWTPILAYIDDSKVNCYPKTTPQDPTPTTITTTKTPIATPVTPRNGQFCTPQVSLYLPISAISKYD